jgi:hypothetical protein
MNASERRAHERLDAAEVPATVAFNQPLRLLDLSESGARVETNEWLAPGRRYNLRIGSPPLQLSGMVVRSMLVRVDAGPDGGRPFFEAGLSFDGASAPVRQQLVALMSRLANRTLDEELPELQLAAR